MRYAKIEDSISNGTGVRVVLWTQSCRHACKGCQNPQTWSTTGGYPYTAEVEEELIKQLSRPYIQGLTLSGGDPLHPNNRQGVLALCQRLKRELPNKDIWLYSGFLYEEIQQFLPELLYSIDILVDGKFELDLYSPALKWKGSSNQRVINIQDSLSQNQVILYEE